MTPFDLNKQFEALSHSRYVRLEIYSREKTVCVSDLRYQTMELHFHCKKVLHVKRKYKTKLEAIHIINVVNLNWEYEQSIWNNVLFYSKFLTIQFKDIYFQIRVLSKILYSWIAHMINKVYTSRFKQQQTTTWNFLLAIKGIFCNINICSTNNIFNAKFFQRSRSVGSTSTRCFFHGDCFHL